MTLSKNGYALQRKENGPRPDWCPEAVWDSLVEELILLKARCSKKSLFQIADAHGCTVEQLRSVLSSRLLRDNLECVKEELAESNALVARKTQRILHEKLADPNVVAKLSPRDVAIISKQATDSHLNLQNGFAGAPQIQMDFKQAVLMLSQPLPKPE